MTTPTCGWMILLVSIDRPNVFPPIRITISSEYPCQSYHASLGLRIKGSTTKHNSKGIALSPMDTSEMFLVFKSKYIYKNHNNNEYRLLNKLEQSLHN